MTVTFLPVYNVTKDNCSMVHGDVEITIPKGEYTSTALAIEITKAFHLDGINLGLECRYDFACDMFRWVKC
jgi:hypothetical protein